eukprot:GHVP01001319.1.p1 GENE.GHVP01001319.1~~GHVP01001319.1.p1  ORF type:complete len:216 (-),score=35.06 GHVP01001319.1:51-698(-)
MDLGKEITRLLCPSLIKYDGSLQDAFATIDFHIPYREPPPGPFSPRYIKEEDCGDTPDGRFLDSLRQIQSFKEFQESQKALARQPKSYFTLFIRYLFGTLIELEKDPQPLWNFLWAFLLFLLTIILAFILFVLFSVYGHRYPGPAPINRRPTGAILRDVEWREDSLVPDIPEAKRTSTPSEVDESDKALFVLSSSDLEKSELEKRELKKALIDGE